MGGDRIKVAELTDAQVQKLHALEQETGKLLVAYEPRHSFAELTPDALAKIKAAEQELGVVLLAYQRNG